MAKKGFLFISLLLIIVLVYLYSTPIAGLPPIGTFFHPTQGFWANAEIYKVKGELNIPAEGISEPVEVFFDERGVPHIFAQNDDDLYFAQGYVTARDRLFQMELQIRAAGGYLAEWLGDDLVSYDKNQRRLGMVYGAERALELLNENETTHQMVQSYSEGVNAYINSLNYEKYPVEYKILDIEPQEWKPLHTALLLKYMTQMLAGRSSDVVTSNTMAHFGVDFVNRYISRISSLMDPVMPPETRWNFGATSVTQSPDSLFIPDHTKAIELWQPEALNGSNNWVVDGTKTAAGYPILSNDMHLNMSVPSIWYEIQLRTPDSNVYGVSLQGAPTVIVGFTENIAWGSTNTGADVMDWYEITFRDESKNEYLHDGEWKPVDSRVETIHVKSGEVISDTIRFTHHGPVYESNEDTPISESVQKNHALRWIAHDPSNELLSFYKLNRGKTYQDFYEAFRTFQAPAQNMNFAGTDGSIGIQTAGKFPLKWQYQGRTVSDGTDPRYDWQDYIPYDQNPRSLNPQRGFLSAANQVPVSEEYPYYIGEDFAPYERGRRINDLLRGMDNIVVDDFKEMLMDDFSYHAYQLLPVLLQQIDRSSLDAVQIEWLKRLDGWNFEKKGNLSEPSVFREWWVQLYEGIWDNKYSAAYPMRYPSRDLTLELILSDSESYLFDDLETEKTETLSDLVTASYLRAFGELKEHYGDDKNKWKWGDVNNTNLNHLGQIPGMGIRDVFTNGSAETINAIRGSHGPSWRMIVELDPSGVRGYGVYPGGQSGNPGAKTYGEFVETWRTGELYELQFLREKPKSQEDYPLTLQFSVKR